MKIWTLRWNFVLFVLIKCVQRWTNSNKLKVNPLNDSFFVKIIFSFFNIILLSVLLPNKWFFSIDDGFKTLNVQVLKNNRAPAIPMFDSKMIQMESPILTKFCVASHVRASIDFKWKRLKSELYICSFKTVWL